MYRMAILPWIRSRSTVGAVVICAAIGSVKGVQGRFRFWGSCRVDGYTYLLAIYIFQSRTCIVELGTPPR